MIADSPEPLKLPLPSGQCIFCKKEGVKGGGVDFVICDLFRYEIMQYKSVQFNDYSMCFKCGSVINYVVYIKRLLLTTFFELPLMPPIFTRELPEMSIGFNDKVRFILYCNIADGIESPVLNVHINSNRKNGLKSSPRRNDTDSPLLLEDYSTVEEPANIGYHDYSDDGEHDPNRKSTSRSRKRQKIRSQSVNLKRTNSARGRPSRSDSLRERPATDLPRRAAEDGRFICKWKVCEIVCPTQKELTLHYEENHRFPCFICNQVSFKTRYYLTQHRRKEHTKACIKCHMEYKMEDLWEHKRSGHNFKCPYCNLKFVSVKDVSAHIVITHEKRPILEVNFAKEDDDAIINQELMNATEIIFLVNNDIQTEPEKASTGTSFMLDSTTDKDNKSNSLSFNEKRIESIMTPPNSEEFCRADSGVETEQERSRTSMEAEDNANNLNALEENSNNIEHNTHCTIDQSSGTNHENSEMHIANSEITAETSSEPPTLVSSVDSKGSSLLVSSESSGLAFSGPPDLQHFEKSVYANTRSSRRQRLFSVADDDPLLNLTQTGNRETSVDRERKIEPDPHKKPERILRKRKASTLDTIRESNKPSSPSIMNTRSRSRGQSGKLLENTTEFHEKQTTEISEQNDQSDTAQSIKQTAEKRIKDKSKRFHETKETYEENNKEVGHSMQDISAKRIKGKSKRIDETMKVSEQNVKEDQSAAEQSIKQTAEKRIKRKSKRIDETKQTHEENNKEVVHSMQDIAGKRIKDKSKRIVETTKISEQHDKEDQSDSNPSTKDTSGKTIKGKSKRIDETMKIPEQHDKEDQSDSNQLTKDTSGKRIKGKRKRIDETMESSEKNDKEVEHSTKDTSEKRIKGNSIDETREITEEIDKEVEHSTKDTSPKRIKGIDESQETYEENNKEVEHSMLDISGKIIKGNCKRIDETIKISEQHDKEDHNYLNQSTKETSEKIIKGKSKRIDETMKIPVQHDKKDQSDSNQSTKETSVKRIKGKSQRIDENSLEENKTQSKQTVENILDVDKAAMQKAMVILTNDSVDAWKQSKEKIEITMSTKLKKSSSNKGAIEETNDIQLTRSSQSSIVDNIDQENIETCFEDKFNNTTSDKVDVSADYKIMCKSGSINSLSEVDNNEITEKIDVHEDLKKSEGQPESEINEKQPIDFPGKLPVNETSKVLDTSLEDRESNDSVSPWFIHEEEFSCEEEGAHDSEPIDPTSDKAQKEASSGNEAKSNLDKIIEAVAIAKNTTIKSKTSAKKLHKKRINEINKAIKADALLTLTSKSSKSAGNQTIGKSVSTLPAVVPPLVAKPTKSAPKYAKTTSSTMKSVAKYMLASLGHGTSSFKSKQTDSVLSYSTDSAIAMYVKPSTSKRTNTADVLDNTPTTSNSLDLSFTITDDATDIASSSIKRPSLSKKAGLSYLTNTEEETTTVVASSVSVKKAKANRRANRNNQKERSNRRPTTFADFTGNIHCAPAEVPSVSTFTNIINSELSSVPIDRINPDVYTFREADLTHRTTIYQHAQPAHADAQEVSAPKPKKRAEPAAESTQDIYGPIRKKRVKSKPRRNTAFDNAISEASQQYLRK